MSRIVIELSTDQRKDAEYNLLVTAMSESSITFDKLFEKVAAHLSGESSGEYYEAWVDACSDVWEDMRRRGLVASVPAS